MTVETLSSAQRSLYEALQTGKSKDDCIRELGLTEGTFAAQCTRIKNKGVKLPGLPGHSGQPATLESPSSPPPRPASTGPGSSESVLEEASSAGPAIYDVEETIRRAQQQGNVHGDMAQMHPMAIMGLTIQFMRLCGGRFHAHQIIEDVYGAVRAFTSDGPSADDVVAHATRPFSGNVPDQEELNQWLGKVEGVKDELSELLGQLPAETP